MRVLTSFAVSVSIFAALAACGGNKAANNSAGNAAAPAASAAAPANTATANTATTNATAPAGTGAARAVMMGGDAELDLCGSTARVKEGRTAIVRDAPEASAREVERLPAGTIMRVCDAELMSGAATDWAGVTYGRPGVPACELGRRSADRVPVPAACASGWVQFGEDVEQIGG